jgi:hypothetical protein
MPHRTEVLLRVAGLTALVVAVLVLMLSGCEGNRDEPTSPVSSTTSSSTSGQLVPLSKSDSRIIAAMSVQEKHTQRLMASSDVVGTAVGLDEAGEVVVKIYTVREGVANLPKTLDDMKVDVEVTGVIRAMGKPGGGGVSHTAKQTPPIQLGTSGGWRYDLANGYCCGGTLGSLVRIGGKKYILSNYHVFEADIASGGNSRVAATGDPVIQPGLIDVNCNAGIAQDVATLSGIKSLPSSNVDAAIAQVIPGMVRTDGAILEIGTISATPVAASINQAVKKSGRTTGLTRSKVSGLNATITVSYENECAGGSAFTKTFTGQIVIANARSRFLNSGDSGSLMVEDITTNPRAVGLLFAGSNTLAIANPIEEVLLFLGAKMVGK